MHLPTIFAKLQARWELRRLEDRYVKRANRSTFISHATYVDGEYVYQYPGIELSHNKPTNKPSKLSLSSFASSSTGSSNKRQSKASWGYKGPMASVGNWGR